MSGIALFFVKLEVCSVVVEALETTTELEVAAMVSTGSTDAATFFLVILDVEFL